MKSLKAVLLAACGVVMTFATLVVSKPPTAMAAGGCCSYTANAARERRAALEPAAQPLARQIKEGTTVRDFNRGRLQLLG